MTDVKKTTSTKNTHTGNKQSKSSYQKKPNYNNEKKYSKVEEVKEAKIVTDDESEKEEDKKLIVIVAIAILIIVATIIGLLVGCNRENEDEPEKKKEDIVVPIEEDEEKEEEVVVKKKTTKSTVKKTSTTTEEEKKVEHDVIYYYNGNRVHFESKEEGSKANEYVPQGYGTCKAYLDENHETEYDYNTKLTDDVKLYLDCESNEYTVTYVYDETLGTNTNVTTFTSDEEIELVDLDTQFIFLGWYLDEDYTNRVNTLNRKLTLNADENNNITLYAKVQSEVNITYVNNEETYTSTVNEKEYTVESPLITADKLLGYSTMEGTNHITYKVGDIIELTGDMTLYAVCGDAVINYSNNNEVVSVGYTDSELQVFMDEEIELPTPSELGMQPTTYFIPVDEVTETSKKVVSDDELEIGEKEVKLADVQNGAAEGYNPALGDNVEEYEKEFEGWNKVETTIDPQTSEEVKTETPTTTVEVIEELLNSQTDPANEDLGANYTIPEETDPIVEG